MRSYRNGILTIILLFIINPLFSQISNCVIDFISPTLFDIRHTTEDVYGAEVFDFPDTGCSEVIFRTEGNKAYKQIKCSQSKDKKIIEITSFQSKSYNYFHRIVFYPDSIIEKSYTYPDTTKPDCINHFLFYNDSITYLLTDNHQSGRFYAYRNGTFYFSGQLIEKHADSTRSFDPKSNYKLLWSKASVYCTKRINKHTWGYYSNKELIRTTTVDTLKNPNPIIIEKDIPIDSTEGFAETHFDLHSMRIIYEKYTNDLFGIKDIPLFGEHIERKYTKYAVLEESFSYQENKLSMDYIKTSGEGNVYVYLPKEILVYYFNEELSHQLKLEETIECDK